MAKRQNQNRARNIKAEEWFAAKLPATGLEWTRQASWGFRLFDFWCHAIGVAIEVDGPEHDVYADELRDQLDFNRSGIIVLHVRNWQEHDADEALANVQRYPSWNARRKSLGKPLIRGAL